MATKTKPREGTTAYKVKTGEVLAEGPRARFRGHVDFPIFGGKKGVWGKRRREGGKKGRRRVFVSKKTWAKNPAIRNGFSGKKKVKVWDPFFSSWCLVFGEKKIAPPKATKKKKRIKKKKKKKKKKKRKRMFWKKKKKKKNGTKAKQKKKQKEKTKRLRKKKKKKKKKTGKTKKKKNGGKGGNKKSKTNKKKKKKTKKKGEE